MLTEPLPLRTFVDLRISERHIAPLLDEMRVEPEKAAALAVAYFTNMGIFDITPLSENLIATSLLLFVRNSPEIRALADEAAAAEAKRKATKAIEG